MRHALLCCLLLTGCSGKDAPKDAERPAPKPPAFDPQSAERSLRWMQDQTSVLHGTESNVIAYKQAQEKLTRALASVARREIAWPVKVGTITETGVGLTVLFCEASDKDEPTQLHFAGQPFSAKGRREWLASIRQGDTVILHGTIRAIGSGCTATRHGHHFFQLHLVNGHVSPSGRE